MTHFIKPINPNRVKTQRELFYQQFPKTDNEKDKKYSMECNYQGEILKIISDDNEIIEWVKKQGLILSNLDD